MNVNSNIRKRNKQAISDRYKKVDTSVNGDAERLVEEHKEIEKRLYPLRIDQRTVIYVTKDKCNAQYAESFRQRRGIVPDNKSTVVKPRVKVDAEEVRTLVQSGMYLKDIAKRLGVSKTTIDNYILRYDLREKKDGEND